MVSRSLEKMMLIAVGLSAAVIVGIPILMYSINLLNNTTTLEMAEAFAEELHSIVETVDETSTNSTEEMVSVPQGVTVSAIDNALTVSYQIGEQQPVLWTEICIHNIDLIPPVTTGQQLLQVDLIGNILYIRFIPPP